jgi:rSAM/selenodomain-associated transferase 2
LLLSIVIPVRRDAEALGRLLAQLPPQPDMQLIVTATDDKDESIPSAADGLRAIQASRPDVVWVHGPTGRGVQLNAGAARAEGRWLWFVHADSTLPTGFPAIFRQLDAGGADADADAANANSGAVAADPAVVGGSFRFALDSAAWQARVWERGVALRVVLFGLPYGDQGLFVRRDVFERMGGFRPIPLMEDVEFVGRLKRQGRILHLKVKIVTSARRWEREGWWRRTRLNLGLLALYYVGITPDELARRYEKSEKRRS